MWRRLGSWNNPSPFTGVRTSFACGIPGNQGESRNYFDIGIGEKEPYEVSEEGAGTVACIACLSYHMNILTHHRYITRYDLVHDTSCRLEIKAASHMRRD